MGVMLSLIYRTGDLLQAPAQALVNPVNTVGVMGKGLAAQFKWAFPDNFRAYADACRVGAVRVGSMFVYTTGLHGPKWIINFPTKDHWRDYSRFEWIELGLQDLASIIQRNKIGSVAVPALGCGNGGLDWRLVKPRIESALGGLTDVTVLVFPPVI